MKRLNRLTALIIHLQSRRYTSIGQLTDKFEVSERTIYRDLNALQEAGLPISFEEGRGYFIVDGYNLPPVNFTDDEANTLIIAENLMRKYADEATFKTYNNAVEKIRVVLDSIQKQKLESLEQNIRVYIPEEDESGKYLSEVNSAIATGKILEINYTDNNGQQTQRRVEPIGLTFYSNQWHVIAYCQLREAYRDFAMQRISSMSKTGGASRSNHWSLDDYISSLEKNQ